MNCLILMATYNGERYICQQIESIINQSFKDWEMIIRDDGSSDKTISYIQQFMERDVRIRMIRNHTNRHGAYMNFWELIRYAHTISKYDYYFFADQDDIWLPDKIRYMVEYDRNQLNKSIPRMIYSDMQVIDKDGKEIYQSINKIMGIGEMSGLSLFYTHGFIWGCDTMINRQLFELVPILPIDMDQISIMSHDNYFAKFAVLFGEVKYLDKVCISHRRHGENKTGTYQIKMTAMSALKQVINKWNAVVRTHARVYTQTLITIMYMQINGFPMSKADEIRRAIEHGSVMGVLILKKQGVKRKQLERTLGLYCIMLLNSYQKYLIPMKDKYPEY